MADNRASMTHGPSQRRLSRRERIILFILSLALISAVLYKYPYTIMVKSTNVLKSSIESTDKEILELAVQISDMSARKDDIKAGAEKGITGWDLADQKGIVLFLEGVSAEAKREGVSLIAVHPAQEVDKEKYKEISMNLDLKGRYRDLAAYFKHLENLSQIVNIRKIRVEACPDSSSACSTQLEAVTYASK